MAMSPEDIQARIDAARAKMQEEKQRKDQHVRDIQTNPPTRIDEVTPRLPKPTSDDPTILEYARDEVEDIALTGLGAAELMTEFGTGLFGAFVGTVAGTGAEILDNDKLSKHGEYYMEEFNKYTDLFTYRPRSDVGHAMSTYVQELMGKFGGWGDQAGDAVFEATGSPILATAIETAITGAPIYVPFVGGKVIQVRKTNKAKVARRTEVAEDSIIADAIPEGLTRDNIVSSSVREGKSGLENLMEKVKPDAQAIANAKIKAKQAKQTRELEKRQRDPSQPELPLEEPPLTEKPVAPHIEAARKVADVDSAANARKVEATQDASIRASEARDLPTKGQVWDKVLETVFDATAGLRKRILGGVDAKANRMVEIYHNRVAGATPKAQLLWQDIEAKVYSGLAKAEEVNLNKIINSMRTIQIDVNAKARNKTPPAHSGGRTGVQHVDAMYALKGKLGDKKFNALAKRADMFFESMGGMLKDLYAEGLITKKQYNSMKGDIYEPRKFLEKLDPLNESLSTGVLAFDIRGKNVKVNDSGLYELSKGDIALMEMNSRSLGQEYTVRAVNRIWRNQANVKLLDWVKDNPDNGFVRVAKKGERVGEKGSIDAYIDGKKTTLLMEKKYALQWVGNTYVMGHGFSNFMRAASGQFIMKPLTTGMNPEFALKLFAVDVVHAFYATDVFSASFPVYALQLGKNLGLTMKDAFTKGDRFKSFISEGGGMNFLTHQGTDVFGGKGVIRNNTTWRRTKSALASFNEGMEIWVRLAIRERALEQSRFKNIKEGKGDIVTPEQMIEATGRAREYIDFSQGGTAAKALDTVFPYFNSVLQATRTLARGAVRNPKRFAYQVAEMATLSSYWAMQQEVYYPELMREISAEDKAKFWIFPTGRSIRNQQGEVQHLYTKIRKDNVVAGLINPFEMAMRAYVTGEVPDDALLAYFKSASPVVPVELSTPTGAAMHTYAYNHDFWGNPVWNDPDLDRGLSPKDEFKVASARGEASSPFYRDLGQVLNMSPKVLEASIKNIAPSNSYLDAFGYGYKKFVEEMEDPFLAEQTATEELANKPFLRKMVTLTHPAYRVMEDSKRPRTESQVHRKEQRDKLDLMVIEDTREETIKQWIKQQPVEDKERLFMSYFTKKELAKIFNGKRKMSLNVPGPFFWNHVAAEIKNPEDKAEVLYWEWRKMPTNTDRVQYMQIANRLSINKQIWPSTTMKHFRVMQQKYGSEGIMGAIDGGEYHRWGKRKYMDEQQ